VLKTLDPTALAKALEHSPVSLQEVKAYVELSEVQRAAMVGVEMTGYRTRMTDVLIEKHGHQRPERRTNLSHLRLESLAADPGIAAVLDSLPSDFPIGPDGEVNSLIEKILLVAWQNDRWHAQQLTQMNPMFIKQFTVRLREAFMQLRHQSNASPDN